MTKYWPLKAGTVAQGFVVLVSLIWYMFKISCNTQSKNKSPHINKQRALPSHCSFLSRRPLRKRQKQSTQCQSRAVFSCGYLLKFYWQRNHNPGDPRDCPKSKQATEAVMSPQNPSLQVPFGLADRSTDKEFLPESWGGCCDLPGPRGWRAGVVFALPAQCGL